MEAKSSSAAGVVTSSPDALLQSSKNYHASFLTLAKQYLDPLASAVSESQLRRQQELRQKRKRGEGYDDDIKVLQLKKVHVDGFGPDQVWEQARRVLDAAKEETELVLPEIDGAHSDLEHGSETSEDEGEDGMEEGMTDDSESLGEEGVDWELDEDEVDYEMEDNGEEPSEGEDGDEDEEGLEAEEGESGMFSDEDDDDEPAEEYVPDPNGLNDGFFSIDDFNKQSEFLEQIDARGEPPADDDEEIDWDADPLAGGAAKGDMGDDDDDMSDDDDEEGGPTFGNMDLNAPEGESDDDEPLEDGEMDDISGVTNANNIMYADFFAPPAQKAGKNKNKKKRGRPNPHNFPSRNDPQDNKPADAEEDIERAMSKVHRDLFEDDDDAESDAGDLSDLDPSDPKSRRSTHERRQAKLAEEIRKLEAANVAKREWQLTGEARAADRPVNSLLEEALDFERAGKPVPVITAEVSEDIEALIKRRIIAGEFDEVLRRRPDDLATGPKRRGRVELDDTKSGKGLAEIYEEEHLRQTDPNFVDAKDEKLKKEHAEIEGLWKNVLRKLDSLSSWHYKPKPAEPNLEIRVDAPAIEMEDARPTAGGDVAGASMLAPQEIYKPGDDKTKTEIVTTSGMPIAREEMTREQKLRRRRREKERIKKANVNEKGKPVSGKEKKANDKKQLLGDLKKGGVSIIGKKGQITDVDGGKVGDKTRSGVGNLKL
ncbi:Mpp10 protein [Delitschia confertaspora ATCC 74209]|uniref:U3 small nucleolar ribonucleoprotein protein MPP10 n=1 Tax=Delitschia confertaspora ATCC 74209 TaxID=1513339 RepID=A0A9P4JLM7_9PLEO|nr:Mpp10 protein [Delitschia confertaspora ATCC 74209]